MSKKTAFIVLEGREINHDGEIFQAGSKIELDEKSAQPLLAVGAIEAPGKKSAAAGESEG